MRCERVRKVENIRRITPMYKYVCGIRQRKVSSNRRQSQGVWPRVLDGLFVTMYISNFADFYLMKSAFFCFFFPPTLSIYRRGYLNVVIQGKSTQLFFFLNKIFNIEEV